MPRLSLATLASVSPGAARPAYDPATLKCGIVHLGLGAFHRAHMAAYTDSVLEDGDHWGIAGVSLRRNDVPEVLNPQDGLYTLVERSAAGDACRVIGSVRHALFGPDEGDRLVARLAEPTTRIVSLTVTEKGYCRNAAGDGVDVQNSDIRNDLDEARPVRTPVGLIVRALRRRMHEGRDPFTVLCCDNLSHNGETTRAVVLDLADRMDTALATWIASHVAFPSTMVDRITPATTDADREAVSRILGFEDAGPVITEPFSQWIVEDRFPAGRPAWQHAGVTFVDDVVPFERMKLRLLNGTHSAMAYLGTMAGFETIAECVANDVMARFVRALMDREMGPTLDLGGQIDLEAYKASLLQRYANPSIRHRLIQIAMDGSQKVPPRWLEALRWRRAQGLTSPLLMTALAGWMHFLADRDDADGNRPRPDDPMADAILESLPPRGASAPAVVAAILGLSNVFDSELAQAGDLTSALAAALSALRRDGVLRTLERTLASGA